MKTLKRHIPNILSLSRMLLILPFILTIHDIFIYECANNLVLLLVFVFIIISDVADGYLARKLNCASDRGAKLDIVSDALYTILSLSAFVYFEIIPIWFVCVMLLKLMEFAVTSKLVKNKQNFENTVFFDKIGKISICVAMLLPGIFVFRCIIIDYKTVMNISVYIITVMLTLSFVSRIMSTIKYMKK
ncbi:MAG: CDP-alcohol phosphatidyltransferase family protein [Spirochaetaceae bacterium]|jgi:CDP-diacylglycerol--glycerol-3-phosphate 3-phosphatidyltransferase|nr:CDP-alcohol phosphatidyltransferase family protein [Spirochaetaceae bacterium]